MSPSTLTEKRFVVIYYKFYSLKFKEDPFIKNLDQPELRAVIKSDDKQQPIEKEDINKRLENIANM